MALDTDNTKKADFRRSGSKWPSVALRWSWWPSPSQPWIYGHRPSWERSYLLTGERPELNREEIIGASLLHLQLNHEFKGLHSPLSWLLRSGQRCKSINEGLLDCETWEVLFCVVFFKHLFPFSVSSLVRFKKYSSILNPVWQRCFKTCNSLYEVYSVTSMCCIGSVLLLC